MHPRERRASSSQMETACSRRTIAMTAYTQTCCSTVVILDDRDLDADVVVEGNRGVIYGDSPAEAVIDGDLTFRGNESTVRGVTITGDVTFDGNLADSATASSTETSC